MFEAVFSAVFFFVLFAFVLVGVLIFIFRDWVAYPLEVAVWLLTASWVAIVSLAIEGMEMVEDWLWDIDILDDPAMRALVMAIVAIPVALAVVILISMILGHPWVLLTVGGTGGFFLLVGVFADPDRDWSPPPFPDFPRRGGGGGWHLPLNL
jgi:hypothetical protein